MPLRCKVYSILFRIRVEKVQVYKNQNLKTFDTLHCTLERCTWYRVLYTVYTVHLASVQCLVFRVQCTVYTAVYSAHWTGANYTVFSAQCTMFSVPRALNMCKVCT